MKKIKKKQFIMIGIAGVISLAVFGTVGALNGWFGGGGSIPSDTMTRGLVSYWSFDDATGTTAYDNSGNGNSGTLTSGPRWIKGKVGGALSFDGVDDYVSASVVKLGTSFTYEGWIYLNNINTASRQTIIIQSGTGPSSNPYWGIDVYTDGKIIIGSRDSDAVLGTQNGATTLSTKTWYHFAVVRNSSSQKVNIYLNGVLDSSTSDTRTGNFDHDSALRIGKFWNADWNGFIDELKIYNRALSTEEVRYHYNRGGPVGYWKFDEGSGSTAYDSTDNNNDGTLYGGIATSTADDSGWKQGKYGSALSFDGVDDYVDCGNAESLHISNPLTMEAWFYPTDSKRNNQSVLADRGTAGGNVHYEIRFQGLYRSLNYWFLDTGGTFRSWSSPSNSIVMNAWNYAAIVANGTELKFYANGVLISSKVLSFAPGTSDNNTTIGGSISTERFNGLIDNVKIYNYARTADEIKLDYNSGFSARFGPQETNCEKDPGSCMTKGLVGYWGLDEGSGTATYDSSGNGNSGTLTNGPTWAKGKVGGALNFDGKNDYVDAGTGASLSISSSLSIEAWVKLVNNKRQVVIGKGNGAVGYRTYWFGKEVSTFGNNDSLTFYWSDNNTDYSSVITGAETLDNNWHYIAVTFNAGNVVLYIDGTSAKTGSGRTSIQASAQTYIGGQSSWTPNYCDGLIDEVRIYSRALSSEEVRYHYNRGGPVGYWKFDEGSGTAAYDSSDNHNDGTLTLGTSGNTTSSNAWVQGKYDTALSFDGQDDYVNVGNGSSLNITSAITLEAWVKYGKMAASKDILCHTGCNGYFLYAVAGSGIAIGQQCNTKTLSTGISLYDGVWHYIVGTYDGRTAKIYVDGVLKNSGPRSWTFSNSGNLTIGRAGDGSSEYFNGLIDDVRIYNYARTADEIKLDYNSGFSARFGPQETNCEKDPGSCMTKGLVGYWSFNEGQGTAAYDSSGNGNAGTLTSGPQWTKGKVGGGILFDGVNDVVTVANFGTQMPDREITVEAWINPVLGPNATRDLIGLDPFESPTNNRFNIHFPWDSYIYWQFGNPISGQGCSVAFDSSWIGAWGHYVFTYSYSGGYSRIYRNGVLLAKGSANNPYGPYSATLRIGGRANYPFEGIIDELKIYSRALSGEEVRYHYNKSGPVAWWKFNEGSGTTVYDSTDNHNDCTLTLGTSGNTTSSNSWVQGKYDTALSFDGQDDYVNCGDPTSLNLTSNFTVETWFYINKFFTDSNERGIVDHTSSASRGYIIETYGSSIILGYYSTAGVWKARSITGLKAGQWYHLAMTFEDAGGKMYGYVDGVRKINMDMSVPMGSSTTGLKIGGGNQWVYYHNGLIDDVRIYNYARTQEQILQDYNAGFSTYFK